MTTTVLKLMALRGRICCVCLNTALLLKIHLGLPLHNLSYQDSRRDQTGLSRFHWSKPVHDTNTKSQVFKILQTHLGALLMSYTHTTDGTPADVCWHIQPETA